MAQMKRAALLLLIPILLIATTISVYNRTIKMFKIIAQNHKM